MTHKIPVLALTIFLAAIVAGGCANQGEPLNPPNAIQVGLEFEETLENYYQDGLRLYPIDATYAGDHRYDHLLTNFLTTQFQEQLRAYYTHYLAALSGVERSALTTEQQLSYDVLEWESIMGLEGLAFPDRLLPIDQFWSFQLTIGQFASGASAQPFKTREDYDNWLARVDVFVEWCDTAIENMREGMASGVVLPKPLSRKVLPQLAAWSSGPAQDHHFFSPVRLIPESMSPADVDVVTSSYTAMIEDKLIPAVTRLHQFFDEEYLPAGRESAGLGALPAGADWYQYLIKYYTTTDLTADEIFEIGKAEVARLRKEMEGVMAQVGFDGDLNAFFEHVRTKPELMPFTDPAQVLDRFNGIHEVMIPNLSRLFDLTPRTQFEVRRTESFREAAASAEYSSGSLDGTRPGIFYVPIPDVSKYNVLADEDLFLHEAIPGHHYQVSLAQENKDLPMFRKTLWYSAYGEGWALYAESLGSELGLYQDPYQYLGMLSAEMHRAIRLVVDTGMHSRGWTRQQAIEYSLANEAEPESSIVSEIERYMAGPGQALSYKIGQLKIMELRRQAEESLGDKFDIKVFHNKVLESGSIPLALLEAKINSWIESQREPQAR